MRFGTSDKPESARRSTRSSTLAIASASGFLVLSGLLSFVPDAPPSLGEAWHLRGPLAVLSAPPPTVPETASGLHQTPKPV